jgi:lipopolysaccharide transport system ATP-binding protein
MSSSVHLATRGLGKRFDLFRRPAARLASQFLPLAPERAHWALRGVELAAEPGTCLGIIGRNGSGKSTLLALLAGIMAPTEGTIEVEGRVAALLELGAGFHPDFTGRENVFLAAAVYGLGRAEVVQRLAAIVDFAGIGAFIDRPVREYSSGMYARLAFAVAAHVDADILIVDEVLGVGDVRFQQRCARFITEFRQHGIVLLVSHSEQTILGLCTSALWLADGRLMTSGSPRAVAHAYHTATQRQFAADAAGFAAEGHLANIALRTRPGATASARAEPGQFDFDALPLTGNGGRIVWCRLLHGGEPLHSAKGGETVVLRLGVETFGAIVRPVVGFALRDRFGVAILGADSAEFPDGLPGSPVACRIDIEFAFDLPFLASGGYTIDAVLLDFAEGVPELLCRDGECALIEVASRHISGGMANVALIDAALVADGERLPG